MFFQPNSPSSAKTVSTISDFVIPASAIRAELFWVLQVVTSHFSLRSCLGLNDLFRLMSIDNEIAKLFQLSKTKCGYIFGLAPYFKEHLLKSLRVSPYFVLSFDESFNQTLQEEQMDLQLHYWEDSLGQVCIRYFDSRFLKRPNAKNLVDALFLSLSKLTPERLLQLSMDGRSTNWRVLDLLDEYCAEKEYPSIINIGSCSLHVVHGAFQVGFQAVDWQLAKITSWCLLGCSFSKI